MSNTLKVVIALAVLGVLGVIAATVAVGSKVREETVVARPYEDGLKHDAERRARADLALALTTDADVPLVAGAAPLAVRIADAKGRPFAGAKVAVELSRPDTGRGGLRVDARETEPGRYEAPLAPPAAGDWDLRADVLHAGTTIRLERRVTVRPAPCNLGAAPCTAPVPGGTVTLELSPRPLRTMADLAVRAEVAGVEPAAVSVSFAMVGMNMGRNVAKLARRDGAAAWEGKAVLVRCPSGRKDWEADVTIERPGAPALHAILPITVAE